MNVAVNPELVQARARIAELEAELMKTLIEEDARERFNAKYTDSIEEALEEVEVELVAERAKAIEVAQLYADAEREIEDLKKECEGLVEERDEASMQADAECGKVPEALGVVADLLRDYLIDTYGSSGQRLPDTLRKVCDELSLSW